MLDDGFISAPNCKSTAYIGENGKTLAPPLHHPGLIFFSGRPGDELCGPLRLPRETSQSPSLCMGKDPSQWRCQICTMSSILTVPAPLQTLFAYFPLYTHPAISPPSRSASSTPTIWIRPPLSQTDLLSGDVECLKWQAYLALRGLTDVAVRWDVSPDGGIDGRLPNLHVPVVTGIGAKTLLAPQDIPAWVDSVLGERNDLEGYQSQQEKDESLAWVALLEGNVRAALVRTAFLTRAKPVLTTQSRSSTSLNTRSYNLSFRHRSQRLDQ